MPLKRITEEELIGKGVLGQADVPALTVEEMQYSVEEIARDVIIPTINVNASYQDEVNAQVLRKDNTEEYHPVGEYMPATKGYVDDMSFRSGSVSSVFGRAGDVLGRVGDYSAGEILMTGYEKAEEASDISPTDSVKTALGKLEKKAEGKAGKSHAIAHSINGTDPLTPEDIGAARASLYTPLIENITEKTTSLTLSPEDLGKSLLFKNTVAVTLTLPKGDTTPLPIGFSLLIRRWGEGMVSIVGEDTSVTLNGTAAAVFLGERYHATASITKVGENEWSIIGGIE